jgi:hypothetical protein
MFTLALQVTNSCTFIVISFATEAYLYWKVSKIIPNFMRGLVSEEIDETASPTSRKA